jgi:actin-related protein
MHTEKRKERKGRRKDGWREEGIEGEEKEKEKEEEKEEEEEEERRVQRPEGGFKGERLQKEAVVCMSNATGMTLMEKAHPWLWMGMSVAIIGNSASMESDVKVE